MATRKTAQHQSARGRRRRAQVADLSSVKVAKGVVGKTDVRTNSADGLQRTAVPGPKVFFPFSDF